MLPFAKKHNVRVILANRRDYPEATPFTEAEFNQLTSSLSVTPEGIQNLRDFLRDRAADLYQLLETLIQVDNVPQKGGIVVGGWSFGTQFTTTLLAHAGSIPVGDIDVASYIRYIVNLDMPSHILGYAPIEGGWNPLLDLTLPGAERVNIFPRWVSGYFMHGETVAELIVRDFTEEISPTLDRMTHEELQSCLFVAPGEPGASDDMLFRAIRMHDITSELREMIVFPTGNGGLWDNVKLRHVFCDRSTWSEFWGAHCLREEISKAEQSGKRVRPIEIVRLRGANHFSAWDDPERTLVALMGLEEADHSV
ncbi:hypothetical protein EUX98_g2928 [Antrodiella citrinella]|uniref:Uncharacterized protein n=1 Tax=Antrodiella citrinella TaxID=2447956 RepID=A0A4S4N649_9APHY|nr:hypothetical protein EUX98_g2928 [Antrodiella citrinella]